MAVSRLSIIKFLELALAVCCFGLHYKSHSHDLDTDLLSAAAFGGYVIILVGEFAGHMMSTPFNRRIDIFFSLVGCALFVAAGAMNIKVYDGASNSEWRNLGLAKASLAIINGALFLLDSLLSWRGDF
ncbi:protein snakeskin [Leptinotarsa decemlineata]|uniref:protein snakeskin n=1 Tax=Leptinotarsa decemlineata TaxID=7539 RepID=UPI000C252798|nr:protein snakeskin-like [Leptinotarsa decemlineata]